MAESADPLLDLTNSRARRRQLLQVRMRDGLAELAKKRSGEVAFVFDEGLVALPVDPRARVDVAALTDRQWLLTVAAIGALVQAGGGELTAGGEEYLVLHAAGGDAELAALQFEENVRVADRVRPRALVVSGLIEAPASPVLNRELQFAERIARLGGNPADASDVEALEDALAPAAPQPRPHDDPDPAARIARRILQRLDGMGKWGGYHTEFAHLARGFASHEREAAFIIGERLLAAGLLAEKTSVGQRHVFLNSRRAGDIRRMIETGEQPRDLRLPVL